MSSHVLGQAWITCISKIKTGKKDLLDTSQIEIGSIDLLQWYCEQQQYVPDKLVPKMGY